MSNGSIWPIDKTLSSATTPGQIRPGNNCCEGVLRIPQSSSITGASPSGCLVSYPRHTFGDSYPSAAVKVNSTAPADYASLLVRVNIWVMAMKEYSTLPRAPQMRFSVIIISSWEKDAIL